MRIPRNFITSRDLFARQGPTIFRSAFKSHIMASKPKNIIIVGGSLAGLLTGTVLKKLGHHVTILERTPTSLLHNQGAGIVFGSEAQAFFKAHVLPIVGKSEQEVSVRSIKGRQTLDKKGEVLHAENHEQMMISWDLVYFLLRRVFDGLHSEYVEGHERETALKEKNGAGWGEAKYEVGRKVVGINNLGLEGVEVECEILKEDGEGEETSIKLRGDLIIAADGPSSAIRRTVSPKVERTYAGYVAWRGTVLESEASEEVKKAFVDKFSFFHDFERGIQILVYLIPGKAGNTAVGSRLINWVWYCNYPADSEIYKDLMTDSDGHHHHFTLPVGKVQPRLVQQQKEYAAEVLSPQFAELVHATRTPFVQAITDVLSTEASFMDGKLLLVGDAVAGFRPHTAASTNQAAYHALILEKVFKGQLGMNEAQEEIMQYASHMSEAGKKMGNRSQFGGSRRSVGKNDSSSGVKKDTE